MAQLSERNKTLADLAVSEETLRYLKTLGYDEAMWRINHEHKQHCIWAGKRRDFMESEMETVKPVKPGKPIVGPPIVSHRGRGGDKSIYGESRG